MKIFTSAQIHEHDKYTIEHEPISSVDLMERAAKAITHAIAERWAANTPVVVFAGPGNNGGDALAVARMLADKGYQVRVYLFNIHNNLSADCSVNRKRLNESKKIKSFSEISLNFDPPQLTEDTLVVDGLFGSGLNKPLSGGFASLVKYINQSPSKVVSIDIPSGLMCEDNTYNIRTNIIRADVTLTLQYKKLAMMFADNQPYIGKLQILDIGLSKEYADNTECKYCIVDEADIRTLVRPRPDFVHKGSMGNALIVAGSYGMAGAAVLATKACLRSGAGKVTTRTPKNNCMIMQIAVPEAVLSIDPDAEVLSESASADDIDALGIGPGLGQAETTAVALIGQFKRTHCPIVADADALNILANHRAWLQQLPKNIIMTPHPKEMDKLASNAANGDYDRLAKALDFAERHDAFIILKGHYTAVCTPQGKVFFNNTGNSGMATAGSGDVLTGILTGLLARGYSEEQACLLGVYLHGLAGDIAAGKLGKESLIASDIIDHLPMAFRSIQE
ncbi:NAD(P)H-hydrate dehydratase [Prevotella sp. P3-122]|uniref:NAD(P)H-hydrate dehydratase n=1 Tax=Prevotella sp. P3-122 TaxID=2024223 RepID=UPI000B960958|nr:NAD(P)H-hydrate dehydratase [Prevotella sp. P3-122]OYP60142.1 bifunctional ADP-dependent NAD(P)H-hydrate dehydratase/NAD(P)H-hydrate epimerase [Prevotella sp. P3-122]